MSKKKLSADAKRYELMLVLNPEIGEDGIQKKLKEIREHLKENGGEIFHEETWGIRDLAYLIRKHEQGFYVILDFNYDSENLKELNKMLLLEPDVLRFLITVLPSTYEPKNYFEEAEKEGEVAEEESSKEASKKKSSVKKSKKSEEASESKKKKNSKKGDGDAKLDSILDNPDLNF